MEIIEPEWIYDIEYLTFSAGGVKGFTFIGALTALDNAFKKRGKDLYSQLKGCSGCSIGALAALLTCLSVRQKQLYKQMIRFDISAIMADIDLKNFTETYGLHSGDILRNQLFKILEMYTGDEFITFAELYQQTKKHLLMTVTNVSTGQVEIHDHINTPNFIVVNSLMASMCIPIIFSPVVINSHLYVDGGILNGIPFQSFDLDKTLILVLRGNLPGFGNIKDFMLRIFMIGFWNSDASNLENIPPEYQNRVVQFIGSENLSAFKFDCSLEEKHYMIEHGFKVMTRILYPQILYVDCVKLVTQMILDLCENKYENKNNTLKNE